MMEPFTKSGFDRHPTEIAMLRGARLLAATETEERRRWAEAKIKQLTSGDRIAARFMRQDFSNMTRLSNFRLSAITVIVPFNSFIAP